MGQTKRIYPILLSVPKNPKQYRVKNCPLTKRLAITHIPFGIYLAPITNDILIKSALENGGQGTAQEHLCTLANVPLQKWMHLAVSLNTRALDVYLDGKLVRTCMLEGVAASNTNSNLRITPNGGFDGYTGSIKYIPDRINPQQAYELYKKGPGGSALGGLNKYKVRVALMEDGDEKQSFEL